MKKKVPTRKILNVFVNALMVGVVLFFLFERLPQIIQQYRFEGGAIPSFSVPLLTTERESPLEADFKGELYESESDSEKRVMVFWATWCGPCTVELNRLQKMINQGKIKAGSVLAISSQDSLSVLQEVSKERGYTFLLGLDERGEASELLNVKATPTILFKGDRGEITWMSSGLSPSLEFRVGRFLN
jgi:cytochrome c biogenesis protein CcmG, thiol:disulfide interchange protein DsbE